MQSMKAWHLHTHDEKLEQFSKPCQYCGKVYVDRGALFVHEGWKCPKRTIVDGREGHEPDCNCYFSGDQADASDCPLHGGNR